jgi:sugar-specific transcriptional regulator TrmB
MSYNFPFPAPLPIPVPIPAPTPNPSPNPVPSHDPNPNPVPGQNTNPKLSYLKDETKYLSEIETIQDKLPSVLDDFKKYYVFYNKNPTYTEYQTILENLKSDLNSMNSELFKISNNVEQNIKSISKNFNELNKLIQKEKATNNRLMSMYKGVKQSFTGSKLMIDEYKQIYNQKFMNNCFILIGIIVNGIVLAKIFASKGNTSVNIPASK